MKSIAKKICLMGMFLCLLFAVTCVCTTSRAQAKTKNGIYVEDGKKYYYVNGVKQAKWVTIESGKYKGRYYFDTKTKAAYAGKKKIGTNYYYFDKKTNKLVTSRYGYKIGSYYYKIGSKGVLTKVSKVEGLAGIQLDACGGDLKKAFTWAAQIKYTSIDTTGMTAKDFALYGFQSNLGDCNVQAACFYYMAKVKGKSAKFVQGYVTNSKQTAYSKHAWVTIGTKVYDVNFVSYIQRPMNGGKTLEEAVEISYGFLYSNHSGHFWYCDLNKKLYE